MVCFALIPSRVMNAAYHTNQDHEHCLSYPASRWWTLQHKSLALKNFAHPCQAPETRPWLHLAATAVNALREIP
jgi:hypothetical protein